MPTLVGLLIVLLTVWLLPPLVENVQFALVRGRERALVEIARQQLAGHEPQSFTQVSEQVAKSIGPSVVHIDTVEKIDFPRDDFASQFFRLPPRRGIAQGQGSGVIIDKDGYILTNNHVVDGASEMTVSLSDGRKLDAELMGGDVLTDLAVLRVDADGLIAAPWGDSEKLPVGAPVWAVGNPYGLDRSITFGIISAKSRRGLGNTPYQEFLQTDAAVNPGNSGGPLVDATGQVVGINTAMFGSTYQGISFAIPSDTAHEVYEQLRKRQPIVRGYLGVQLVELTPDVAKKLGLKDVRGALVADVVPGGPADRAGIERGDVIVAWHGQPVDNKTTLQFLIARSEVGSAVECTIVRDGQDQTKTVQVTAAPAEAPAALTGLAGPLRQLQGADPRWRSNRRDSARRRVFPPALFLPSTGQSNQNPFSRTCRTGRGIQARRLARPAPAIPSPATCWGRMSSGSAILWFFPIRGDGPSPV